jgi:hypothetical protein
VLEPRKEESRPGEEGSGPGYEGTRPGEDWGDGLLVPLLEGTARPVKKYVSRINPTLTINSKHLF